MNPLIKIGLKNYQHEAPNTQHETKLIKKKIKLCFPPNQKVFSAQLTSYLVTNIATNAYDQMVAKVGDNQTSGTINSAEMSLRPEKDAPSKVSDNDPHFTIFPEARLIVLGSPA